MVEKKKVWKPTQGDSEVGSEPFLAAPTYVESISLARWGLALKMGVFGRIH